MSDILSNISVLILVGGRGTRISHLAPDLPKPLILVNGKPFLHWIIKYFSNQGFRKFVLSAGYLHKQISDFAENTIYRDLSIKVVVEDVPLGTGGAVMNSINHCSDSFLVINGDSLTITDLKRVICADAANELAGVIIGVEAEDASRFGTLDIDKDSFLLGFREKCPGKGLINAGIYYFFKNKIANIVNNKNCSIEYDIIPTMLENSSNRIKVINSGNAEFIDIGTPESLSLANVFVGRHMHLFKV